MKKSRVSRSSPSTELDKSILQFFPKPSRMGGSIRTPWGHYHPGIGEKREMKKRTRKRTAEIIPRPYFHSAW